MFCKYNKILGIPKKGIHSIRIINIAIIDVIMTIILSYIIHFFYPKYKIEKILLILFILGIFFHRLFCVSTTIDKLLFT